MCGWDTNGLPDYATALHALMEITALGKYTTVPNRRVPLRSPSRDMCGRANALAAWAYASTPAMTTTIPPQAVVSSCHFTLQNVRSCSAFPSSRLRHHRAMTMLIRHAPPT